MLCLRREELDRDIPNDSPVEIEHCSSNGVLLKPANDLGLLQIVVKKVGSRTAPASSIEIHLSWFTLGIPKEIPLSEEATIMDRHHSPTRSQLPVPGVISSPSRQRAWPTPTPLIVPVARRVPSGHPSAARSVLL